ncbi:MAG: hypothetical protein HQK76_20535 [Desulfobacterales bacterium]|nr:hypothetical protein [Desulfobacterales bacterium]
MDREKCINAICLLENQLNSLFDEYENALLMSEKNGILTQPSLNCLPLKDFLKEAKQKTNEILIRYPICRNEELRRTIDLSTCEDIFGNIEYYFRHTLSDFNTVLQHFKIKGYVSELNIDEFYKSHGQSWFTYGLETVQYNKIV